MRVHIYLDDEVLHEVDDLAGPRGRSSFIEEAVRDRVDREIRWRKIEGAFASISDEGHPWDPDPAGYFHESRRRESEARDERLGQFFDGDR